MPIDIDRLSESELIDLSHRIVARLRFLRELDAHASMLEFRIGVSPQLIERAAERNAGSEATIAEVISLPLEESALAPN